jgi:hypothetical protein
LLPMERLTNSPVLVTSMLPFIVPLAVKVYCVLLGPISF